MEYIHLVWSSEYGVPGLELKPSQDGYYVADLI